MEPSGYFNFDLTKISEALGISENDTQLYFTDGRRVSFLIERRAVESMPGSRLAPSEGSGFDLIDRDDGYWEVRSLTKGGIYFCPSYMVGSGRKFDEDGFIEKLDNVEGYFVTDITRFPEMPYWIIRYETVKQWWHSGDLGKNSKIPRTKFLNLIRES
ncbi:MAG: hypothetical protein CMA03_03070 [Euryarchaeota archaeon]|nr:hypothetical protein [Euryarchaeota archaeon]